MFDRSSASDLWVITCYFNPGNYQRRLANFREFRRRLAAPLVAVELAFDGPFELSPSDADVLVRLRGGAVLFQKERLLNIAWRHLPPRAEKIAWLDADVFFETEEWISATVKRLDDFPVVMPYSRVAELRRDTPVRATPALTDCDLGYSLLHRWNSGELLPGVLQSNMRLARTNAGLAWACRRDAFEGIGFYDACVAGSGNRAILGAALGHIDDTIAYLRMSDRWAEHYRNWAHRHFDRVQGRIGSVDATVFHLWHGDLERRRYSGRHQEFAKYAFDPGCDIGSHASGCWAWSSEKPQMHEFLRRYFVERREDG
jgi:hypothetical protein